jgi:hypothetical protein
MQKWEYKCIEIYNIFDDTQAINKKLNELGALGWELVSFITQVESVKKRDWNDNDAYNTYSEIFTSTGLITLKRPVDL